MTDIFGVSGQPIFLGNTIPEWVLLILGIGGTIYTHNPVCLGLTFFWLENVVFYCGPDIYYKLRGERVD
jgi:hypothetical protein